MRICGALCRKKKVDESSLDRGDFARVLNTFDLTALGIGSTLGVGIYVLAGEVSKCVAGPAVIVSFLLAAIASIFAGLCYAEFGARVPKAGSAYIYSYYIVGELVAFFIGWSLILEYMIGTASVARGISTYIDCLINSRIKNAFLEFIPIQASFMAPYFDLFAFSLCIALAFGLAFGVRESTVINNVLTFCNVSVVIFVIVSGLFKADFHNWQLDKSELPGPEAGEGGFAPFGFMGIIKGAAMCFYGFIGFDCIATTGEEVKNPQKAIPLSIMASLLITFLAYFGVSSVLTLMWPYYLQDREAPLPYVYTQIGWDAAKWLVSLGALFGLFSSFFGAMFPLPRILYAMASDGLIFRSLGEINPRTKTPVFGTAIAGLLTATMSALFNLEQLVGLMALGTLIAYTIVAICVLVLRYSSNFDDSYKEVGESTGLVSKCKCSGAKGFLTSYFSCGVGVPTCMTKKIVVFNIITYTVSSLVVSLTIMHMTSTSGSISALGITFVCFFGAIMLIVFLSMCFQPKAQKGIPFQMPCVPLLPCLSIFINIYLMVVLEKSTWIKLALWMGAGIIPYLCWYFWKYCHGDLGENSRYSINRVNNIKLNELVWKLLRDKKTLIDGYVNEGFTGDSEPGKTFTRDTTMESIRTAENVTRPPNPGIVDEIHTYNECQEKAESVEINNNVYPDASKEYGMMDENGVWKYVAEVHAVAEDECLKAAEDRTFEDAGEVLRSESPMGKAPESRRVSDSPQLELVENESLNKCVDLELTNVNEQPVADKSDSKTGQGHCDEDVSCLQHDTDKVFGAEIPIRKVIQRPRVKLNLDKNFKCDLKNFNFNSLKSEATPPENENGMSEQTRTRRGTKLLNNEMREKLNRILQDQASFIQSGLMRPSVPEERGVNDTDKRSTSQLDIKTLTKTEIMNKLQHLLKNGPPNRHSFRMSVLSERHDDDEEVNGEHRTEGT